ncbi:o-succinylbenzoate synthase [Marivirga tractuosa]|uniref:Mandelate racemase/muconate lactonizing protein n=1 Tax=Marivirga tractuosa (strain ATCC 23168 / DSM 4126 / NBRC 15989 / NCIMB 1408 / VKM B-1430 / H-43) TaxID=643867 RepID=E4TRG7_MARTH|nr:o-succinylbenzoate synthase [Marivirga tractuosa]ADR20701.1 Mandelate racemase/muconate lactonizing protein [Marivirga tractuosa DSM 4126]BDD14849.1 o-succinylbenzoate synthase [Marivirga tractuosa]
MQITSASIQRHTLQFKFEAGTSRGTLKEKDSWYLKLFSENKLIGIGEAGPLKGLSIEPLDQMETELEKVCEQLIGMQIPKSMDEVFEMAQDVSTEGFPSIRFAVETALLDALHGGKKLIFDTPFYQGKERIPINGLIWMGSEDFMKKQIREKLEAGFDCIKMKIGAIDFETELKLLKSIRAKYSKNEITLRVDANGAFLPDEAISKLTQLAEMDLHSIEQPIKAGQVKEMAKLCAATPLPIALDEELIGVNAYEDKIKLLKQTQPQYIILKPSLIGGIQSTLEWIKVAESLKIGWWMTSMLESNIGLNAICQLASYLKVKMPQGLGTGQLYHNNIASPISIANGETFYDVVKKWEEL